VAELVKHDLGSFYDSGATTAIPQTQRWRRNCPDHGGSTPRAAACLQTHVCGAAGPGVAPPGRWSLDQAVGRHTNRQPSPLVPRPGRRSRAAVFLLAPEPTN